MLSGTVRNLTNDPPLIIEPEAPTDFPAGCCVGPILRYGTDDLCLDRRVHLRSYSRGFGRWVNPPSSFRGFRVGEGDPTREKDGNADPQERNSSHEGNPGKPENDQTMSNLAPTLL